MTTSDERSSAPRLRVRDMPGFGSDPDLAQFTGDEPAHVTLIPVTSELVDYVADWDKITAYRDAYLAHGPWALPPVACLGDPGWQVAGVHRMHAAHLAGVRFIPAFIIDA